MDNAWDAGRNDTGGARLLRVRAGILPAVDPPLATVASSRLYNDSGIGGLTPPQSPSLRFYPAILEGG
jgi:hypothetical protein